jgi:hypothetical protein
VLLMKRRRAFALFTPCCDVPGARGAAGAASGGGGPRGRRATRCGPTCWASPCKTPAVARPALRQPVRTSTEHLTQRNAAPVLCGFVRSARGSRAGGGGRAKLTAHGCGPSLHPPLARGPQVTHTCFHSPRPAWLWCGPLPAHGDSQNPIGAAWCTRFPFLPEPLHQLPDGFEHGRCGRLYSFGDCGWPSDLSRVIREGSEVSVPC